jgi:glycosyltransferase involved in cell wall biosynthesis
MQPLFTVITVTLNGGDGLRRTAESVDRQAFESYEHLVKDGGSSDGSLERLPVGPRRRVHRSADTGIYDAMNQALAMARGEWLLFLNAGDAFVDGTVLEQIARAVRAAGEAELVYSDYYSAERGAAIESPPRLTDFFLYRTMLCHQSCFFRSSAYRRLGGFDTGLRVAADFDFLVRAVKQGGVVARHAPVVATTYMGGGFSTSVASRRRLREEVRIIRARYHSPARRLAYGLAYAGTLPALRQRLLSVAWLGRLYTRCVNLLYRASRPVHRGGPDPKTR